MAEPEVPAPSSPIAPRKEFFSLTSPLGLIGAFTAIVDAAFVLGATQVRNELTQAGMLIFAAVAFFYCRLPRILAPGK